MKTGKEITKALGCALPYTKSLGSNQKTSGSVIPTSEGWMGCYRGSMDQQGIVLTMGFFLPIPRYIQ